MAKKVCSSDSLIDSSIEQVYICLSKNDYFALCLFFKRLYDNNLISDDVMQILHRFHNSIIDIVDCVGTSIFDRDRI